MLWGGQTKPHADAQEDAWEKILLFLQKHLYQDIPPEAKLWNCSLSQTHTLPGYTTSGQALKLLSYTHTHTHTHTLFTRIYNQWPSSKITHTHTHTHTLPGCQIPLSWCATENPPVPATKPYNYRHLYQESPPDTKPYNYRHPYQASPPDTKPYNYRHPYQSPPATKLRFYHQQPPALKQILNFSQINL